MQITRIVKNQRYLTDDPSYDELLEANLELLDTNYFLKKRLHTEKRDLNLKLDYKIKQLNLLINVLIVLTALVFIIPTTILVNL